MTTIPALQISGGKWVRTTHFKPLLQLGRHPEVRATEEERKGTTGMLVMGVAGITEFETLRTIARATSGIEIVYGGGIRTIDDVNEALQNGANKILLGKEATGDLITEILGELGSESLIVSLDHDSKGNTAYGSERSGLEVVNHVKRLQELGVRNVMLHSIERDGMTKGMDLETIRVTAESSIVRIMAMGGHGNARHIAEAEQAGAKEVVI